MLVLRATTVVEMDGVGPLVNIAQMQPPRTTLQACSGPRADAGIGIMYSLSADAGTARV